MNEQSAAAHTNRLAGSTSPYLLQHAHNPVDWYPWGEEALRRAREEDKPILLSIGYSACHWCHVMERESFENEDIAALMNAYFVSIKVDREERPDLDEIYMAATQAMNQGQGGWPMTVFLTPDLHPFFAGTYFPPEDRHGRPGFPTVLGRIAELWQTQRDRVRGQAAEIVEFLRRSVARTPGASLGEEALRQALADFAREYDERHGGFGAAPKFPPAASLMLLLRLHRRLGDGHALEMARKTLDEMARGGMYDQVGGGFHRYSVDEQWLVPHFEKMLYDNALLARAYLEGHQATGDPFHARIAAEILDYVLREMTSPEGGFYSATDADSEGEEGRFFVWTPEQVEEALGDPEAARVFCAYYDITARGNWEGTSIPNTSRTGPAVAGSLGLAPEELERRIATLRAQVYAARKRRVAPGLDDKVLASWNALMIGALAEGHRVLGDPRYLEAAERAARFVLGALRSPEGRLLRTWRAGRAHLGAYLEDYAFLCEALVDLYEAGAAASFLREAERLAAQMLRFFADPAGGFFSTASDHETLIVRHREGNDGAIPGANAAAARALARLSFHFGRDDLREEAARALQAWGRSIERHPRAFSWSLIALDLLLDGPVELAFVGPRGAALDALRREVARHYLPNRIAGHHDPAEGPSDLPLLAGKQAVDGRPALYVCRGFTCQRPVTDPAGVAQALGTAEERPRRASLAGEPSAGSATPEGTSAYVARQPAAVRAYGYRDFGKTGLRASIVGFGGYRVDESEGGHAEALRKALLSGCNLVDTSTNYMDGSSERLIGQVLADLRREGALAREEVVVVSKIGYVQGHNLEAAEERERQGRPYPDMVKHGEGLWHCIHPEFLADQLSLSLERLGLETLDVCLLHNPEYYLIDAHERSHGTLEKRREEFYRRLAESFEYLEAEVESGRIRCYGVSSNTVAARAGEPEATSLPDMLRVAQAAGGDGNHFRVLQLPLNLFEPAGVLERDAAAGGEPSVLALAAERNLAILVNRPLNAVAGAGMLRLADVEVPDAPDLEPQARVVAAHEAAFRRDIGSKLRAAEGSVPPDRLFRWADDLRGVSAHIQGLEHWEQLEGQRILPRLAEVLQALDRSLDGEVGETWRAWRAGYLPELQGLLAACRRLAAERSRQTNGEIRGALSPLLPEDRRSETLSRQAIWVAASTPGVTTVLVGMRRPQYVEDALKVMEWPPAADVTALYTAVRTQATD